MQKKQINKEIIHKLRMKLRTLKLEDKLDVFPIENTFTRRQRYWIDGQTGKAFFKVHMWNLNSLEEYELEQEINARISAARAYFQM